ncbi:MAG: hypothetical protein IKV79_06035 [Oscillospiraceae bacterium]|nr:hypothetical protein [Oscillospiraceae bacterium]
MSYSSPFAEFEYYLENFDFESFGERFFTVFAVIILSILGIVLLFTLASYIFESIAFCTIAKRRQLKNPWLAWIPLARSWTMGAIVDEQDRRVIGKDRHFRIVNLADIVIYFLAIISTVSNLATFTDVMDSVYDGSNEMIFASVLGAFATFYSGIMSINMVALLLSALRIIVIYKLFESVTDRLPILFTLLSLFIPLFFTISIFCLRKKGYEPEKVVPQIPEAVKTGWYDQD